MKRHLFLTIKTLCISAMLVLSACNKDEVIEINVGGDDNVYCTRVLDFSPAPGQFINRLTTSSDPAEALAAAESVLTSPQGYVSLGGFGGYVVVGFDRSIANSGGYDFAVLGNSFDNASEPGIVWVMRDDNGNGVPDDTWYELRGSEYDSPDTQFGYEVTYFRPSDNSPDVSWSDNRGETGVIKRAYYPSWIESDSYTLAGSRLAARNEDTSGGTAQEYWENRNYEWGYADNFSQVDMPDGDGYNYFRLSNAVDADGRSVNLPSADFVKIQCAVNASSGWLGEISTEVFTVKVCNTAE